MLFGKGGMGPSSMWGRGSSQNPLHLTPGPYIASESLGPEGDHSHLSSASSTSHSCGFLTVLHSVLLINSTRPSFLPQEMGKPMEKSEQNFALWTPGMCEEGGESHTHCRQFLMRTRTAGNPPPPRCPLRGGLRGEESGCNPREAEFVVHMRNTF